MKNKEEKKYVESDLTIFLKPKKKIIKSKRSMKVNETIVSKIEFLLKEREEITKSELYKWSKKNNISPSILYNSLNQLINEGVIKRVFDSRRGEIVYKYLK